MPPEGIAEEFPLNTNWMQLDESNAAIWSIDMQCYSVPRGRKLSGKPLGMQSVVVIIIYYNNSIGMQCVVMF